MNKNVKFWHSLKVKPGLINLKTGATQWRAGVGRQRGTKVREAGERTREAGDSDPPVSPHHLHKITTIYKAPESFGHLNFPRIPVAPVKFVDRLLLLNVYQQSFLQTEGYCRPLEPQCDFFLEHSFSDLKNICLQFGCNLLNDSEIIQENWVCDLIVLTIKSQTQFSWRLTYSYI